MSASNNHATWGHYMFAQYCHCHANPSSLQSSQRCDSSLPSLLQSSDSSSSNTSLFFSSLSHSFTDVAISDFGLTVRPGGTLTREYWPVLAENYPYECKCLLRYKSLASLTHFSYFMMLSIADSVLTLLVQTSQSGCTKHYYRMSLTVSLVVMSEDENQMWPFITKTNSKFLKELYKTQRSLSPSNTHRHTYTPIMTWALYTVQC